MKKTIALQFIASSSLFTWANGVLAHDGQGLLGSHWHPIDSRGFVPAAVLAAAAVWLSQKN